MAVPDIVAASYVYVRTPLSLHCSADRQEVHVNLKLSPHMTHHIIRPDHTMAASKRTRC